jgi:hypothetical protein
LDGTIHRHHPDDHLTGEVADPNIKKSRDVIPVETTMRNDLSRIRLLPAWLRVGLIAYMLGAMFLVAVHQHQDGLTQHDCALCAAAQTPALVSPVVIQEAPPTASVSPIAIPADLAVEPEFARSNPSRAPPLA